MNFSVHGEKNDKPYPAVYCEKRIDKSEIAILSVFLSSFPLSLFLTGCRRVKEERGATKAPSENSDRQIQLAGFCVKFPPLIYFSLPTP